MPNSHILSFKNFRTIIAGKFFISISIQIIEITAFWEVLKITNSPLALGLVGLAEASTVILFSIFSGYYIDLYRKKKILILCNSLLLLNALFLWMFRFFAPDLTLHSIYIAIAIIGIVRSFSAPTNVSLLVASIPKVRLPESAAWNGSLWHVAFFGGAFLGGLINGFFDSSIAYIISIVIIGLALLFNLQLPLKLGNVHQKQVHRPSFTAHIQALRESIAFLRKEKILLASVSVDMMVVFFAGVVALLPIFAENILKVGAEGLGFLRAAPGVGALCISLFLTRFPKVLNTHTGIKLLVNMSLFGFSMLFFAISTNFFLSLMFLFLGGLFDGVSVVIRSSLLQIVAPESMRGRLAAINSMFVSSSNELGALESGVAAEFMGVVPSVIFGSTMIQILLIMVLIWIPELKRMNYSFLLNKKL